MSEASIKLKEVREFARDLRSYFQDRTRHLKFMAEFQSTAVDPRHQLRQLNEIGDEAIVVFDEFLELTESIHNTKRNRHVLPHVNGEVRNIRGVLEKFFEQWKVTQDSLTGQLNSPTRTSTEIEGIFDFVIACVGVLGDKMSSRQSVKLDQVRKRRKKKSGKKKKRKRRR